MDETVRKLKSAYDAVAYGSGVYLQTHPDLLAVAAALRGISSENVERCRVLELGCASGGNLIPMAEQLPESRFLGIDLSERQIETGLSIVRELGLTNIELRCQDIMEFPADAGQFDYIIAHGVYSWVPPHVQQKVLAIFRTHLAPRGIGFVSYNTYPGWRQKEIVREMMLYHARDAADPVEQIARGREIVQFVAEHTQGPEYYREFMRQSQLLLAGKSDQFLLHDNMEAVNEPRYFRRFVEEVNASGLAYVGESGAGQDVWLKLSAPVRERIAKASANRLEREQYIDFLIVRTFRNSVLCLAEAVAEAASPASGQMRDLFVAGNPPDVPAGTNAQGRPNFKFGTGDCQFIVSDPRLIAVLRHLRRAWPAPVPFAELLSAFSDQEADPDPKRPAQALELEIAAYYGVGLIELWSRPSSVISLTPGVYPRATRFARWQAAHNLPVSSLRHSPAVLDDAFRQLIPLLDGTRDRKALAAEILRRSDAGTGAAWPHKTPIELEQLIESALNLLAGSRLLLK